MSGINSLAIFYCKSPPFTIYLQNMKVLINGHSYHFNVVVNRYKCLLIYLSTTITHPVSMWRLLFEHIINDNIKKFK